jgi:hypothetical protein
MNIGAADKSDQITRLSISTPSSAEADEEQEFGIRLRDDLLQLNIESVEFAHGAHSPKGAKGDAIAWNQLFVTLLASGGVLTALVNAVIARISASSKRTITLEIAGDKLSLTSASSKDQKRLVADWIKRHRKD